MQKRKILLVEPSYRNKYPPLGLMKIAAYHKARGDQVQFEKLGFGATNEEKGSNDGEWDRVYVTTLFSFEWKKTAKAIDEAIKRVAGDQQRVFVGGISASLMHGEYKSQEQWAGVRFVKGLLTGDPAEALGLKRHEFGQRDKLNRETSIEERIPNYDILKHTEYEYPVHDAYFGYASRGCIRKCKFCGVPTLEGDQKEMPAISELVDMIRWEHGEKRDLILMDNNITASSRYAEVLAEIRDAGFEAGATTENENGNRVKRRLDFNQGVDARILVKSPMYLREMSRTCISPLRIAFDHTGMRKVYQKAIEMAAEVGITRLSNYMLYNFMDTPKDLYDRMALNIELNERLGIRVWSFPMRYQPVTLKDRSHVGRKWNRYFLRSFQIMLQPTHGLVSGNSEYFNHAYGVNFEEFEKLLRQPHAFTFHRQHYETGPGAPVKEEYERLYWRLSPRQQNDLTGYLRGEDEHGVGIPRAYYRQLSREKTLERELRELMWFHTLDTKDTDRITWGSGRPTEDIGERPTRQEHIEDAGLFESATT